MRRRSTCRGCGLDTKSNLSIEAVPLSDGNPRMIVEKPRRWRPRFKSSTMLFGVLLLCVLMSWLGAEFRRSSSARQAAAQIQSTGGTVRQYVGGPGSEIQAAAWLSEESRFIDRLLFLLSRGRLGFRSRTIEFGVRTTLNDLNCLPGLRDVRVITFLKSTVTKEMIEKMAPLKHVRCVNFFRCNLSDEAIAALSQLDHLTILTIVPDGPMGNISLKFMENFKSLRVLDIRQAIVQSAELKGPAWNSLRGLDLSLCTIAGDPCVLTTLPNLHRISLCGTGLTSESVRCLSALPDLELLDFRGNMPSDSEKAKLNTIFGNRIWVE
jgi:hypothetical protein